MVVALFYHKQEYCQMKIQIPKLRNYVYCKGISIFGQRVKHLSINMYIDN